MTLHSYLPQDRLRALARGETLPDRTSGSALFADISGFTALTESLRESLGARQGAEELSRRLGAVYSALIAEVEKVGGSVIGFAGDAMMCWIEGKDEAAVSAVACAFGMQAAIQSFPELGLKVAITSGDARRFVVGDPEIQKLDALAGATVARTATAEHHAQRGDVLLDEASLNALGDSLTIKEWREDGETKERFAAISTFTGNVDTVKTISVDSLNNDVLQSWVHHAVYERETTGQGTFLTEFRPCVALFVRFMGIDYDLDSAESELDAFIRQVQRIASRYNGTLMDITIGDKGSYAYVNFGALSAHEDDSRRAVKAALELRKKPELQLQMGITQGLMRVGAYGGVTRKTFGALGDDVNLAARLMTTANEGEILLSGHVRKGVANDFISEPRSPLPMKGKAEPLPVFAVTGESQKRAVRLQEPNYALPMVGRQQELGIINDKLELAEKGQGQVIGIVAEAGLGKSRLVAEVIRSARKKGFIGYGGACQSDAIHTPYQAWKSIWQAFFGVDPDLNLKKQMRFIEGEIEDRVPSRVDAMPLLNVVLDLNIPENDFTKTLEPKIRRSALHALLEDCLKAQAKDEPTLIVIEDLHWIDALSHDLLEGLAKALANHAVCFVLAYRPPQLERLQAPRIEALEQFTRIELHELTQAEAESAIRAKLAQLYPARGSALPKGLVDTLMARAQGNPFYLEELLNYVRDRGLDPSGLHSIELPDSLHTLILSRIDQLSEQEKTTLRVASIVGRLFRAAWLNGYYPELGSMPQVKVVLDQLDQLDITPLDSEPDLTYLFKHIVTHEVTYESLPFATRARLHEQLAKYLESAEASVETIAFHYTRSENKEKQCEYLRKAGEAAQKSFANDAALEYYGRLLPLLNDAKEQAEIYLKRGEVSQLLGKYDEAESDYRLALNAAKDDATLKASVHYALGTLNDRRGEYEAALEWLAQAKEARKALNDTTGLAQVLIWIGVVMVHKGEYVQAREPLNEALALARQAGDKLNMARAQHTLGLVALYQGDYSAARTLYEESLVLRREMGDKGGIANSLNNLGLLASAQGEYAAARALYEESLVLDREMGDKRGISAVVNNLGLVAQAQGDFVSARSLYEESLVLDREMGDKWGIAIDLGNLGLVAYAQGDYITARTLQEESLARQREIGNKAGVALSLSTLGFVAYAQGNYAAARASFEESLALCKEMDEKTQMASALLGLGLVDVAEDKTEARQNILHSLRLRQETGERLSQTSSLVGIAALALHEGNPQFAAELLGTVESALKALGAVVEIEVLLIHPQTLAAAREQLGETAFQSAWEEGSQWSLEEAVKRALDEQD
jgi:class 3 adenylate cyclase/predicted ATPase